MSGEQDATRCRMTPPQDSVSDVERLRAALTLTVGQLTAIREANDPDDADSYRCDDREGCLDWTHAAAAEAEKAGLAALAVPINKIGEDAK